MNVICPDRVDLLVVGGGVNGTGIARDAAGRGLKVLLVEQDDLGAATSSASSKLIHGGLRYLEQCKFRLVAQSLAEREVLLGSAPHIVRPMRFVMPHVPTLRPAWLIRAGLLLYDGLARRQTLASSHQVDLRRMPYGAGLKPGLNKGFVYSDCWVDDARLVIFTAMAAAKLGAVILPRTQCLSARREGGCWRATLRRHNGDRVEVAATALANVTGPWTERFLRENLRLSPRFGVKLVKGSHIVVPRLYQEDHAYILQNDDRRVIFVYPYEERYTLIGTTDVELTGPAATQRCEPSMEEVHYLVRAANRYFLRPLAAREVVWRYCGVRPLFDDGAVNPSQITRDYLLTLDASAGKAPVLSVVGGKITTYRQLAERALEKLLPWFPEMGPRWTRNALLPGGDLPHPRERHQLELERRYPLLPSALLRALARRHGSLAERVLSEANRPEDLGQHFGAELYAREVRYFREQEWAYTAEDVLWRRTKAGLHLGAEQAQALVRYLAG